MKSTIAKKTEGYGYKYTELADINKYCEDNGIRYYQEIETSEINQKDYIITYLVIGDKAEKHRGCQIVEAVLSGIKNPVQEYGSSLTYCRRYSLLMALGLATEDDDGASLTQITTKEEAIKFANNYVFQSGKHKDMTLKEIIDDKDLNFIHWLLENSKEENVKKSLILITGISLPNENEKELRIDLTSEILKLCDEKGVDSEEVCTKFQVKTLTELTTEQMNKCIKALEKKEENI